VLPRAKKHFWTIVDVEISNQIIISTLQTIERAYRWLGAKENNISLNTRQLLAMSKYFTYKGPTISLNQVVTKKCNII